MPKLRNLSGEQVIKILAAHGFIQVRQKGSHVMMRKQIDGGSVTVPVPLHNPVKVGTLGDIIHQSSLPRALFEA